MKRRSVIWFSVLLIGFTHCDSDDPRPLTNDGSLISFVERLNDGTRQISIVTHDGASKNTLFEDAPSVGFAVAHTIPRWSFDRKKIVFISNRDGEQNDFDIYTSNADGSNLIKITDNPNRTEEFPCFAPNGQTILFTAADEDGNTQFFTMDASGKNEKQITFFNRVSDPVLCYFPSWSHDGKKIIFNSNKDNAAVVNIYIMSADGSEVKAVTNNPTGFSSWGSSISPDNKTIVYYTRVDGNHQVFTIETDGTNKKQITNFLSITLPQVDNGQACWSPDGTLIAFMSNKDKNYPEDGYDLYTIDINGTNVNRLTDTNTVKFYPDWR